MSPDDHTLLVDEVPLCVDLDGTLIRSDTLVEAFMALLKHKPWILFIAPFWLLGGRAALKAKVAAHARPNVPLLPVHEPFLAWLQGQKRAGRRLVLCTAAHERIAHDVAQHFGIFDQVIASTDKVNLSGRKKAERLKAEFGAQGFDYAGNEIRDLEVWRHGRRAIIVAPSRLLAGRIDEVPGIDQVFDGGEKGLASWLRAMRLHQWAKNVLVFLPALTSHMILEPQVLAAGALAFLIFSMCASGTYMLNDLMDLEADRRHPNKRQRPFASAELPLLSGLIVAMGLVGVALLLAAAFLGPMFFGALSLYVISTLWYSTVLKRIAMVDALALAGLYTLRVLAGGAATEIVPSFWLLAFSMFLFLSLAMAKRYAELVLMLSEGKQKPSGRGYTVEDLPLIQSCGAAAGYISVLVLALYVNSDAESSYSHPEVIWLLCPLLLYWISRIWIKTHRGQMHDDPVVFALTDRPSILTVGVGVVLIALAI